MVVSQIAGVSFGGECDRGCFVCAEVCRLLQLCRTFVSLPLDLVGLQKRVHRIRDGYRTRIPFVLTPLDGLLVDWLRDDDRVEQVVEHVQFAKPVEVDQDRRIRDCVTH